MRLRIFFSLEHGIEKKISKIEPIEHHINQKYIQSKSGKPWIPSHGGYEPTGEESLFLCTGN